MKYAKMLSLALVAAAALMAFVGAGSASATVLCKVNTLTSGCAAGGQDYAAKTKIVGTQSGSGILETTGGTTLVTCTGSTLEAETANTGGTKINEPVVGVISKLTWSGCTNTVTTLKLGLLEIHSISSTDNGTLTAIGTEVTVNGIFGESCVYGAGGGTDIGTVVGGSPASITINAIVKKTGGGGLCPAETRWTTKYNVTSPTPLYVSAS